MDLSPPDGLTDIVTEDQDSFSKPGDIVRMDRQIQGYSNPTAPKRLMPAFLQIDDGLNPGLRRPTGTGEIFTED